MNLSRGFLYELKNCINKPYRLCRIRLIVIKVIEACWRYSQAFYRQYFTVLQNTNKVAAQIAFLRFTPSSDFRKHAYRKSIVAFLQSRDVIPDDACNINCLMQALFTAFTAVYAIFVASTDGHKPNHKSHFIIKCSILFLPAEAKNMPLISHS
jgi:hypothetical protein